MLVPYGHRPCVEGVCVLCVRSGEYSRPPYSVRDNRSQAHQRRVAAKVAAPAAREQRGTYFACSVTCRVASYKCIQRGSRGVGSSQERGGQMRESVRCSSLVG